MEFGYRTSRLKREDGIVLAAAIELAPGDKQAITDRITELAQQRKDKQPLEFASAGSTFKRPEGYFAGKLIQDAGLKGFRVGDAQVSEKHAGFVINRGNASAAQIRKLIEEVQRIVLEDAGVQLEREVIFLGEF
jgi:UDP-N-acetylmuramate dehydrogenase